MTLTFSTTFPSADPDRVHMSGWPETGELCRGHSAVGRRRALLRLMATYRVPPHQWPLEPHSIAPTSSVGSTMTRGTHASHTDRLIHGNGFRCPGNAPIFPISGQRSTQHVPDVTTKGSETGESGGLQAAGYEAGKHAALCRRVNLNGHLQLGRQVYQFTSKSLARIQSCKGNQVPCS